MRQSLTSIMGLVLLFAGLSSAQAQEQITVKVPFSFVVNGSTLPAGTYSIRQTFFHQQKSVLLRGATSSASVLATTFDDSIRGGKLVFHRYGERYFLTDVSTPMGNLHFSPARSEMRKQMATDETIAATGK